VRQFGILVSLGIRPSDGLLRVRWWTCWLCSMQKVS